MPNPLFNLVNLTNAAGDDLTPAWSPASVGKLAFSSNRGGQFDIYTIPATGGAPWPDQRQGERPRADWSPDGAKITFSSNRSTSSTTFGYEIYVMGAPNGNSQNRITTIAGDDKAPFWLDANRIVFSSAQVVRRPPDRRGLAIVAPTGGASVKISNTTANDGTPASRTTTGCRARVGGGCGSARCCRALPR